MEVMVVTVTFSTPQVVYGLTYHRMAMHEGVDTQTLRKALWNYIQCVYGIRWGVSFSLSLSHCLTLSLSVFYSRSQALSLCLALPLSFTLSQFLYKHASMTDW